MTVGNGLDLPTTPHSSEGPENDGFFEDLGNTTPYLKLILEGFPGSGKTLTMVKLAIGLHRRIASKKPIIFISTEKAGKFLKPFFDEAGVKVLQRETRSPADLKEAMKRCQEGLSDIALVDSISHFWEAFVEAYLKKANKSKLEMQDWGTLKKQWKAEITDPFVNNAHHYMMTGRAGYEYDSEEREDNPKKRDIFKSGIKMKAEGELAYEPDILVLMSRHEDVLGEEKKVWREASILKDRSTLIDGKTFTNPTFEVFAPAIERLLADPRRSATTPAIDSTTMFKTEEDRRAWMRRRDIALESIENELTMAWTGSTGGDKAMKLRALKEAFEETAWTKIQTMRPEILEAGLVMIRDFIAIQKVIERVDADLLTVWPGSSAENRTARRVALLEFFKVETVGGLDTKGYGALETGIKAFRQKHMPDSVPPAEDPPGATAAAQPVAAVATIAPAATPTPPATEPATPAAQVFTLGDLKKRAKKARVQRDDLAKRYGKESLDDFTAADIETAVRDLDAIATTEAAA